MCRCTYFQAKRDNAKKTGTGGGKSKQPDEVDEAIYDILERDSVVLDGLNLPESNVGSVSILESVERSTEKDVPIITSCILEKTPTHNTRKRRKLSHPSSSSSSEGQSEMTEMKLELLRVETYYRRLKALKLERELGIPPSPITSTVCSFPMEESSGDACDDTVVLFNGNMNIALQIVLYTIKVVAYRHL